MVPQENKIKIARNLRKNGHSYSELVNKMKMSKRDIYKLCKDINFSNKGYKRYILKVKGIKKQIKKQEEKITIPKVRILGHLFFDGSLFKQDYHYTIMYINSSYNLVKQFIKDMFKIYGLKPTYFKKEKGVYIDHYRVKYYSKEAYKDLIKYTNSYSTSDVSIKIPDEILKGDINLKKEFIRTFWVDEGSVSIMGKKVSADLKNYNIIKQLGELHQELGLEFNIISYKQGKGTYFKIYLKNNKENLKRFYDYNLFNLSIISKGYFIGYQKKKMLKRFIGTLSQKTKKMGYRYI